MTSFERSLASIPVSGQRMQRIMILANPFFIKASNTRFSELGLFKNGSYTAGAPKLAKHLRRWAKDTPDLSMRYAVRITMKRLGGGFFGTLRAAVANLFGRYHSIDVIVGGSPEDITRHMRELGDALTRMQAEGILRKAPRIELDENGCLQLNSKTYPLFLPKATTVSRLISYAQRQQPKVSAPQATPWSTDYDGPDDVPLTHINPASGLPMIPNMPIDVAGNPYGTN